MHYEHTDIPEQAVPRAASAAFQHLLDTYASETNKTADVWRRFSGVDLAWRPHPRSASVEDIIRHHLLSERRFFGEFLGNPEPPAGEVIPSEKTLEAYTMRLVELASARLHWLGGVSAEQWIETIRFFDVDRQRIWVFWRRILHSAHHRTQLTVYLRLLDRPVPAVYGPTADATWSGADPTTTVEAAERRG